LSNFSSIEKNVKIAAERTWEGITNWLVKAFVVYLEHQCLSVMALINKSEHVYWELVPLEGTPRWRSFIRNACRFGLPVILFVQVFQKGWSSSQVHEEAEDVDKGEGGEEGEQQEEDERNSEGEQTSRGYVVTGFIDEGEGNPEVMRQYQRELEADERGYWRYWWGTYEASYHNLPSLLHTIVQMNPGSYYDIKDYACEEKPGKLVLQRSFLALGACIEAFQLCRPVICIDGTFLIGKYKGTILIVVTANSNNQWLPLAIAFAEGENGDSWY
jgi:hypothetical protein